MSDDTNSQGDGTDGADSEGGDSTSVPPGEDEPDPEPSGEDEPGPAGDDAAADSADDGGADESEGSPIVNAGGGPEGNGDSPDDEEGFVGDISRRDAIKGTIGGTLVAANAYLFDNIAKSGGQDGRQPGVRERFSNQLKLNVNGRERFVKVEDQERLAETLRYKLGLTGTKFGCDRAMCGACTVQVDGDPIYSCTYFTRDAVGTEIETIEGLEDGGSLHPLQETFIEHLGGQCAFCTPGMIMSGKALLEENGDPSRAEVKEALSGNLCRCGNYENEITGVLEAAKRM